MRLKLALMIVALFFCFSLLINYFIGQIEDDSRGKLVATLIHSHKAYTKTFRVNKEERLDVVRGFASEQAIIDTLKKPAETEDELDDKHFKIFEKLEVLSNLKYYGDTFIVLDKDGNELARTLVATWKKNKFGNYQVVQDAINGNDGEDIWQLDGRIQFVDITPIRDGGSVIGLMVMANVIDEELVKQEQEIAAGEFSFFSNNRVITSSLSSLKQGALNKFVQQNSSQIAKVLSSKNQYFKERIKLGDETFLALMAPIPASDENGLAGFMILRSESYWLKIFDGIRNFIMLLTILFIVLGVSISFLLVQKAYDAIDFILEGAHQIIVGNKEYQFVSNDEFLNQLGQTLNLMIAILLGKYIPEDEEEAAAMAMRGTLDGKQPELSNSNLLIETVDENASMGSGSTAEGFNTDDEYYNSLYDEFIDAKKKVGEDVSQITKDKMIAKLKRAEVKLLEKHGCVSVRFNVKVEGGKVALKPTPIWK